MRICYIIGLFAVLLNLANASAPRSFSSVHILFGITVGVEAEYSFFESDFFFKDFFLLSFGIFLGTFFLCLCFSDWHSTLLFIPFFLGKSGIYISRHLTALFRVEIESFPVCSFIYIFMRYIKNRDKQCVDVFPKKKISFARYSKLTHPPL